MLEVDGNFILSRSMGGTVFLVWTINGIDLELISEIEMDIPQESVRNFLMKGKILAQFSGISYNLALLVTTTDEAFLI